MPITPEQRQKRKNYLGSSDIAAILGFSRWKSSYDVWLEKTDKVADVDDENDAMHAGTRFENGVLDEAEERLGSLIRNTDETPLEFINTELRLMDHPDAILADTQIPVEAKTAGLFGPVVDVWGEDGTDQVPDHVILQAHVHMICTARELCHVIAFIGGRGFGLFHVELDQKIEDAIAGAAQMFWVENVQHDTPPDSQPSIDLLKRVRRQPDSVVDVDPAIVAEWMEARRNRLSAEKIEQNAQTALIAALGDSEAGQCEFGLVTYYEQTRNNKPRPASVSTFRTLRLKQVKGQ